MQRHVLKLLYDYEETMILFLSRHYLPEIKILAKKNKKAQKLKMDNNLLVGAPTGATEPAPVAEPSRGVIQNCHGGLGHSGRAS